MKQTVSVLVGAGAIGMACARRVSASRHIVLADVSADNASFQAESLRDMGYKVTDTTVDVRSRESVIALTKTAQSLGDVERVVHAAGVSPSHASAAMVLNVDLLGTAMVLECFGKVIADGGSGLVIASQAGHRLPAFTAEEDELLAITPTDSLLSLDMLANIDDAMLAYQIAKRTSALRVRAESIKWARRGGRLNALSPGITMSPLARKELSGHSAESYRNMIESCAAGRAGTTDEIAALAEFVMSETGAFMSGTDILMDGGATAAYFYGDKV